MHITIFFTYSCIEHLYFLYDEVFICLELTLSNNNTFKFLNTCAYYIGITANRSTHLIEKCSVTFSLVGPVVHLCLGTSLLQPMLGGHEAWNWICLYGGELLDCWKSFSYFVQIWSLMENVV